MPATHDLDAWRLLAEVARRGSLSAAARGLGVSQQAASARVRALEAAVGTPLLVRSPAGTRPTDAGLLVLGWADDLLTAADRLDAGLLALRGGPAAPLRVAASQTIAESLLPGWLVRLRSDEEHAGRTPTAVDLAVVNSTEAIARVRDGRADVGLIETPHVPHDLARTALGHDELVVVVGRDHPWARRTRPLPRPRLAATPLVMREPGSGTRDALAVALAAEGLAPVPALELGTTAAVRSAIAAGTAPGVLSRLAVHDDLVLGRLVTVEVAGPPLVRDLTAVRRRGASRAEADRLLAVAVHR